MVAFRLADHGEDQVKTKKEANWLYVNATRCGNLT